MSIEVSYASPLIFLADDGQNQKVDINQNPQKTGNKHDIILLFKLL